MSGGGRLAEGGNVLPERHTATETVSGGSSQDSCHGTRTGHHTLTQTTIRQETKESKGCKEGEEMMRLCLSLDNK